jgi:hypothetical protein
MCERRARSEKRTLPAEFWKKDKFWKDYFLQQVTAANRIFKRIDPEKTGSGPKAVSLFLRSQRGQNCYSLSPGWVIPIIEEIHRGVMFNQQPVVEENKPAEPEPPPVETKAEVRTTFVPSQAKKSTLSALENL